jgi:uncharacterized protein
MVGRIEELAQLKAFLNSNKSEFITILGRRRIGKTYLIDQAYEHNMCFAVTGIQDEKKKEQLENFNRKLYFTNKNNYMPITLKNWGEAFFQLRLYLETLPKNKKQVIFLDELPWISTAKSGFLQQLAHLWNDYLSKQKHFILIVCGSASSWIKKNIINDKGGLHNRVTCSINLSPFTLKETKDFFESKKIKFTHNQIAQVYMALGGIPFYLNHFKKGESVPQALERICFADNGPLRNEYSNLYKALFKEASNHEKIVAALATSQKGMLRSEIIAKSKVRDGGPFNRAMDELLACGFIGTLSQFGTIKREEVYRMQDEFSIFYHRFIKKSTKYIPGNWQQQMNMQSFKISQGYLFELLIYRHIELLRKKLRIRNTYCEYSTFYYNVPNTSGLQIDLLIDRNDSVINYCEIKYYTEAIEITKKMYENINSKIEYFKEISKSKKNIQYSLITNLPIKENNYSKEIIDNKVNLDEFFE